MIRTQIYISEQQAAALKALAATSGRKQSELIREAMDDFLARRATVSSDAWKAGIRKAFGALKHRDDIKDIVASSREEIADRLASYE